MWESLIVTQYYGYNNIMIVKDSNFSFIALTKLCSILWRIKILVQDIKILPASFSTISFNHVYCETNFVANKLANLWHEINNVYVWFTCLSLSVYPALYLDKLWEGCCRKFFIFFVTFFFHKQKSSNITLIFFFWKWPFLQSPHYHTPVY